MNPDFPHPTTSTSIDAPAALEARLQALEAHVLQLQTALGQAQALFRESPGAAFLLTDKGRIHDVNARGAALLESSREALRGRSLTHLLPSSSQSSLAALLAQVFAGRGRQTSEVQLLTPSGELLEMTLAAVLHGGADEAPLCHVTLTDVTAFKLAHRALLEAQQAQAAQLQHQGVKLRQLQAEFENVVLLSGRELDVTVTRAQRFLTLSQQPDSIDAPQHTLAALQQTQSLLDSLKRYMQVRFLRIRTRPVDLEKVLREVLEDVADQHAGRDVQLTKATLPILIGDGQALQIIVHEYVHNALKFTRTRPQVRLRILVEEDHAEYRIGLEDNGVGFNMRQKDKAFELFGKLHAGGVYEGTGLGLAVVRRLCERFGGRAWGEGKPDQGATFWIAWPKSPTVEPPG